MNYSKTKSLLATAIAAVLVISLPHHASAAAPATTAPATQAAREAAAIMKDLQAASLDLQKEMRPLTELMDAKVRADVGPKLTPPLKKMAALVGELSVATGDSSVLEQQGQMLAMLTLLGDADAEALLKSHAASTDAAVAQPAKMNLTLARWWAASSDEKAQSALLDQLETTAKADPKNDHLAESLMLMEKLGASSPAMRKKAHQIVLNDLTGELAQHARSAPEVDKPLTLSGPTIDGKTVNSADLKGKVILVDFWATWCGPCVAEMPDTIAIYEKYHAKGLEVIGISLDRDPDALKKYLVDHPAMAWPQIYQEDAPLATKMGVDAIPTLFLIDRNGVLRTIEARGQLEELVPKLLAEKPAAATTAPAIAK